MRRLERPGDARLSRFLTAFSLPHPRVLSQPLLLSGWVIGAGYPQRHFHARPAVAGLVANQPCILHEAAKGWPAMRSAQQLQRPCRLDCQRHAQECAVNRLFGGLHLSRCSVILLQPERVLDVEECADGGAVRLLLPLVEEGSLNLVGQAHEGIRRPHRRHAHCGPDSIGNAALQRSVESGFGGDVGHDCSLSRSCVVTVTTLLERQPNRTLLSA